MYNFIEYRKNDSHTSGSLCQYYRDELVNLITSSASFTFKTILLCKTNYDGIINAEITVSLILETY